MGRGFGSKDRLYNEVSPRYGDKERRSGWGVAPTSRNLWVGNLSSRITESVLSEEFLRFGEIETIAYVPGRSYAFIKFVKEEDADLALRALHGSNVAGMAIRIEFAKGDDVYMHRKDDRRSMEREESPPPFRRDFRQNYSPEKPSDKSKSHRSNEPSEVLWIGFPPSLNVDEITLRRAFSPFGEIDTITSFPGRSYAFVRFRSVVAAFRAKEALHGRFLNNPRVNICFAKSDLPNEHGKVAEKGHFSHLRGPTEKVNEPFHGDEGFDSPVRDFRRASPPFGFNFDRESRAHCDPHTLDSVRSKSSRFLAEQEPAFYDTYENTRFREFALEKRASEDVFERHRHFERPQRIPPFIDSWGLEDDMPFHQAKKHKSDLILPDKDLPEYPFSDFEQEKKHDGLQKHAFNKSLDSVPFTLKHAHDASRSLNRTQTKIDDSWGNIRPYSSSSPELQRSTSDSHKLPPRDEIWKWEGTIAKGGTPVFRARCFPVGKVLDFILPEFLNCTARTGLDMLAKHYYQAVGSWVVFFVPESDADISFYNDFMHYLGEKQRAAVAKLGEKVTLFLVPPSDFSEQVLKVPGKVSISGVILKFQQTASLQGPVDLRDSKAPSLTQRPNEGLQFHEGHSFLKPNSPDFRHYTQKWDDGFSYSTHPREEIQNDHIEKKYDRNPPMPPNWPNRMIPSPNPSPKPYSQPFSKELQNSTGYMPEIYASTPAVKSQGSSITSKSLQPEQLAHLAVLLGNQKQSEENLSLINDDRVKYSNSVQNHMLYNTSISQNSEQEPSNNAKDDAEVDPEKRLQATLQLAAALLQQIQQRSKPAE